MLSDKLDLFSNHAIWDVALHPASDRHPMCRILPEFARNRTWLCSLDTIQNEPSNANLYKFKVGSIAVFNFYLTIFSIRVNQESYTYSIFFSPDYQKNDDVFNIVLCSGGFSGETLQDF